MSIEVESKYRVADLDALAARLAALGAEPGPAIDQVDRYLAHPARDFRRTGEAFRIRRVGPSNRVTYKGPRRWGPTKTREEIEIPFAEGAESLEALGRLLDVLGFPPVAEIRKHRRPFRLVWEGRASEVVLDEVAGLGTFAEVEVIAGSEADVDGSQAAVLSLARRLGLEEVEARSYLRMHLERSGD